MKNIISFLVVLFIVFSCTDTNERDTINYIVSIENSTNQELIIRGYTPQNDLEFEYIISSMSNGGNIQYSTESFGGYVNGADSIIMEFPNSKGYICDLRQNGNMLCFTNKYPFGDESNFNNLGNNTFEFVITQEDFDNAHDLPE